MTQESPPAIAPPGLRQYICRRRDDLVSFDVGPPGFSRAHARVLGTWGMMALCLFPLGVTGLFLGTQSDDWELGIRAATIGFGAIGALAGVGPLFWVLSHAWLRRERIQLSPSRLLVRVGHPFVSRKWTMTELSTVELSGEALAKGRKLLISGPRLRVSWGERSVLIGTGLSPEDQAKLLVELKKALFTVKYSTEAGTAAEWRFSAKITMMSLFGVFYSLVIAPVRHPSPYIFCDLLTIGAIFALPAVGSDLHLFALYPVFFVAFLIGVLIRCFDSGYLSGLSHYHRRYTWFPVAFVSSGFCVGLAGGVSLLHRLHWIAALAIPVVASVWVHAFVFGRAMKTKQEKEPTQRFPIEVLSSLTLIPMAIVHEHGSFLFFEDASRRFFILALPMVLPVVAFVYLPIRMHYFIDSPKDRSNAIWFGLTVTAISVYAVFGVSLF